MKKRFRSADRRLVGAAVVSGLLLVPLGIFGGSALARTASGLGPSAAQYQPSAAQYQYKVTICHRTHSTKHPWVQITISNRALKAHLNHGDKFPPPCPTTGAPKQHGNQSNASQGHDDSSHGNSGNHGNNGHHGKS